MSTAETESATRSSKASALYRDLGLLDATMLVMGAMIGSGIFITSAESARLVGAPGWLLLAWALAGLMTVSGAITAAEVAAMMPRAGGQYVFLRVAYGPMFGFLFGWSMFLVVQTGTIAAVAVAFAKFLGVFWPAISADQYLIAPVVLGHYAVSLSTQQIVAIVVVVVLTITNTQGLRLGALIQNVFTFAKTAALVGLIVIGLTLGVNWNAAAWTSSWWHSSANGWSSTTAYTDRALPLEGEPAILFLLGLAMIGPLFSQSAWNNVTFTGGETRDPGRTLPRALFLGTVSVVGLYLLANVAYLVSLPFSEIQHAPQDRVGTAAMEAALGPVARRVMAAAILVSTFGCVNGLVLAGARVYYAMARDRLFFNVVAGTNKHHVPSAALVAQGLWAALLTLSATVALGTDPMGVGETLIARNLGPPYTQGARLNGVVSGGPAERAGLMAGDIIVRVGNHGIDGPDSLSRRTRDLHLGSVVPVTVLRDDSSMTVTMKIERLPLGLLKIGNLYGDLLEYIIPVDVMFYTLMVGAVIALRIKAPKLNRPYRAFGYPVPALIYIALAAFLVIDFIYLRPKTSGIGFLIVLAGIPVYLIWSRIGGPSRTPMKISADSPA
jgi:APA family basic amino acid/polyamine antiporter